MIARIWHGWTTPQNADKYETLLKEEVFVGIQPRLPQLHTALWNAFDYVYDHSDCAITYAYDCMNEATTSRAASAG